MNRLPATGILVAVIGVLVGGGYVALSPGEEAQPNRAAGVEGHLDPHVGYYQQHLIDMGIAGDHPQADIAPARRDRGRHGA